MKDATAVLSGAETWGVVQGDCLAILAQLPDQCIDAVVTDPPYMLGFMNKEFDRPDNNPAANVALWRQVLRVLKPGGHLLAFGGTRTSHRMVCAIEDAGAEIRDSIHWLYGSGFPKSLSVSKAIDAAAGAEREVVGVNPNAVGRMRNKTGGNYGNDQVGDRAAVDVVTAPTTPAAKQWDGWGTALKPSHEPICLARKPLAGTVAQNVCTHGTGAINVDGCRVAGAVPSTVQGQSSQAGEVYGADQRSLREFDGNPSGRWPPNAIFTHSAGCERVGVREVKAGDPDRFAKTDGGSFAAFSKSPPRATTGDASGREPVPVYECAPGCPVAELGRQSGESVGAQSNRGERHGAVYGGGRGPTGPDGLRGHNDTGTAARFFHQFEWQEQDFWPFRYIAKASRAEREMGCDSLPAHTAGEATGGRAEGSAGLDSPRAGSGRTGGANGMGVRNAHPT